MANGGGPACRRLRVVADPDDIDPRFLATEGKLDGLASLIENFWPRQLAPADLISPALIADVRRARRALLDYLELTIIAWLPLLPNLTLYRIFIFPIPEHPGFALELLEQSYVDH